MTTVPATRTDPGLAVSTSTAKYLEGAVSEATRRAYVSDMEAFAAWAQPQGRATLPADPEAVADFLAFMADAGYSASTIGRRLAAISSVHKAAGFESPTRHDGVRRTHRGIRRSIGTAQVRKSDLSSADLRASFTSLGDGPKATRDRALLLWGLAGAFRRSELVALDLADLEPTDEGYRVTVRRSKTDQEAAGMLKAIVYGSDPATCPVVAMRRWLEVAGIDGGPIFRAVNKGGTVGESRLSSRTVANTVKACAEAIGKDPADFSGHSLRAGFVTEAARAGASERAIQNQTGHRSVEVLRGYVRRAGVFDDNAVTSLGL